MKSFLSYQKLLPFFTILLLLVSGCKEPETVIVNEDPTTIATDTTQVDTTMGGNAASFRKLVIGDYNPVTSLDPLFAENTTSMRAIQLVYEGLVRFDARGTVIPALAKDWSVSGDSLQYTFHLNPDIFYHDSDVFSTGTGRKMTSQDVEFAFRRMAYPNVPPHAAHLFMDIKGFESYYQEQHFVYNPDNRSLDGITGIQAPNDTTVVFQLVHPDPDFLKKLATPLAVIYPEEALGNTSGTFTPIGSGPFNFSQKTSDSTYIFAKFRGYYAASDIKLNRIDITTSGSESKLFRSMSAGNIYVLPQLGPELLKNVLNSDGTLAPAYSNRYSLRKTTGTTEYVLRYNPDANLPLSTAKQIAGLIQADTNSYFNAFPDQLVSAETLSKNAANSIDFSSTSGIGDVYSTYSDDPFIRTFLGNLSRMLAPYQTTIKMTEIRPPTRNTGLFFTENLPLIPNEQWNDYQELFRFRVHQVALERTEISGLDFNSYPWWFNPRNVTLPAAENLN